MIQPSVRRPLERRRKVPVTKRAFSPCQMPCEELARSFHFLVNPDHTMW